MKTIGLLGGMSWESTATYYRLINQAVRTRSGGVHSAKIAMVSVDFDDIHRLQHDGDWDGAGRYLAAAAQQVEAAGADLLLLCTNTMHIVAADIAGAIGIPMLNLLDVTADAIAAKGLTRVGLLGTRFTMEQPFYREHLQTRGIEALVPDAADRQHIHDIIYDELCQGVIRDASRDVFLEIIEGLASQGAQGIVAGCTEIGLLIAQDQVPVLLVDTTQIHADAAVDLAMRG